MPTADSYVAEIIALLEAATEGHNPALLKRLRGSIHQARALLKTDNAKYKLETLSIDVELAFGPDAKREGYAPGAQISFARNYASELAAIVKRDG